MLVFNLAAGQILKIDHITWSDTIRFIWLLFLFVCSDWEFYSMGWIPFIFHLNPLYCRSTMCCSNLLFLLIVFVFFFFWANVHVLKIYCNSETSKLTKFNRNCKRMQRKQTDKNSTAFTFFATVQIFLYTNNWAGTNKNGFRYGNSHDSTYSHDI